MTEMTPDSLEDRFNEPKMVHVRKQHRCCECGEIIWDGDECELFSGKFTPDSEHLPTPPASDELDADGRVWRTWRTCIRCVHARRRVKELLPSHQHPKREGLAAACKAVLASPGVDTAANIINKFCNTYRTQNDVDGG